MSSYLLFSPPPMHAFNFVGQRSRAKRVRVHGPLVNITEGHLLGQQLLAFRNKVLMCLSLGERYIR